MLSQEANERLTRVGPGTPCGELMRRYWAPISPLAQLLEEPVRRVRLLGEDLTLFRTRSGKLGLIGERCLHRGFDLRWGIPDEDGLRCPYHGWLYGPNGECLDTPLEAADSTFKHRLCIKSYPVEELGGLVFAYMGPPPAPLLPRWDLFVWPNAIRQIAVTTLNCNWLQCQENTGDPTHSVWLHGHWFKYILERAGKLQERASDREAHTVYQHMKTGIGIQELYVNATAYGMEKGIVYSKALGADADRVTRHSTVIFPFFTEVGDPGSPRAEFQIRVPMDDTHTSHLCYQVYAAPPGVEAPKQETVPYYEVPMFTPDGKPILDYVLAQDMIGWWAQGETVDRTQEHLGRTDIPIVFLRRQIEEQIRIVEQGGEPMNVFRDRAAMGDMLHGGGATPAGQEGRLGSTFRSQYHKGFIMDDVDRYGPAAPLIQQLHRGVEEAAQAAAHVAG
ncbi:MAG: Rieske 2Fe-2S domain-containing protein [Chloroflexota bacterium]|nr:Rieske 2Fe-2S domain-containing protein [Chloroflexota bacterium]